MELSAVVFPEVMTKIFLDRLVPTCKVGLKVRRNANGDTYATVDAKRSFILGKSFV
jgi:hypothetical protein